jgi:hypothetical protein
MRYRIEIAASLFLAPVASEGVGRPLANLRMLVIKALKYETPGFRVRLMVEEAEAVASNAPVAIPETRPDCRKGCPPEANEPLE